MYPNLNISLEKNHASSHSFIFFLDESCNLSEIVLILISASVRRFFVSRMQDSFNSSLLTPHFLIFSLSVVGEGKGDFFVITPGVFWTKSTLHNGKVSGERVRGC